MASDKPASSNDKPCPAHPQTPSDNPFVKFRHHVDEQIGLVLKGMQSIIGLPSTFSKSNVDSTTQWAVWDEHLKERDESQQMLNKMRESRSETINRNDQQEKKEAMEEEDIVVHNRFPRREQLQPQTMRRNPWEESLDFLLPHASSLLTGRPFTEANFVLPYVLFSPYSPLALSFQPPISSIGFKAQSPSEELPYRAAFEDLLLASRGQKMRPLEAVSAVDDVHSNQSPHWLAQIIALTGDGNVENALENAERRRHNAMSWMAQSDPTGFDSHGAPPSHSTRDGEHPEEEEVRPTSSEGPRTEYDLIEYITGLLGQQHRSSIFDTVESAMRDADRVIGSLFREVEERGDVSDSAKGTPDNTQSKSIPKGSCRAGSDTASDAAMDGIGRFVFDHIMRSNEKRHGAPSTSIHTSEPTDEPWFLSQYHEVPNEQVNREFPKREKKSLAADTRREVEQTDADYARQQEGVHTNTLSSQLPANDCVASMTTTTTEETVRDGVLEKRVVVRRTYADGRTATTETVTTELPSEQDGNIKGSSGVTRDVLDDSDFESFVRDAYMNPRLDLDPAVTKTNVHGPEGQKNDVDKRTTGKATRKGWFWE
ncbi:MAG: hypothetical protein M1818_008411 [Claussenomyces sp. TS43310]|nr:MAG: hypothetical protein M1818_008411 [Claussenomyces sp. TS43310]